MRWTPKNLGMVAMLLLFFVEVGGHAIEDKSGGKENRTNAFALTERLRHELARIRSNSSVLKTKSGQIVGLGNPKVKFTTDPKTPEPGEEPFVDIKSLLLGEWSKRHPESEKRDDDPLFDSNQKAAKDGEVTASMIQELIFRQPKMRLGEDGDSDEEVAQNMETLYALLRANNSMKQTGKSNVRGAFTDLIKEELGSLKELEGGADKAVDLSRVNESLRKRGQKDLVQRYKDMQRRKGADPDDENFPKDAQGALTLSAGQLEKLLSSSEGDHLGADAILPSEFAELFNDVKDSALAHGGDSLAYQSRERDAVLDRIARIGGPGALPKLKQGLGPKLKGASTGKDFPRRAAAPKAGQGTGSGKHGKKGDPTKVGKGGTSKRVRPKTAQSGGNSSGGYSGGGGVSSSGGTTQPRGGVIRVRPSGQSAGSGDGELGRQLEALQKNGPSEAVTFQNQDGTAHACQVTFKGCENGVAILLSAAHCTPPTISSMIVPDVGRFTGFAVATAGTSGMDSALRSSRNVAIRHENAPPDGLSTLSEENMGTDLSMIRLDMGTQSSCEEKTKNMRKSKIASLDTKIPDRQLISLDGSRNLVCLAVKDHNFSKGLLKIDCETDVIVDGRRVNLGAVNGGVAIYPGNSGGGPFLQGEDGEPIVFGALSTRNQSNISQGYVAVDLEWTNDLIYALSGPGAVRFQPPQFSFQPRRRPGQIVEHSI